MEYLTLGGHTDRVNDCAISPDGRFIASASSDHTLKIWDTATGAEYFSLTGHKGVVNNCAISPDGRFVVSASADGTLKLWDLTTLVGNFSPGRPTGSALIEAQLKQVGWVISPYGMGLNTELWQDVAFSDFPNLSDGYLLFVQGQPVGVIKVRRIGDPLAGIEEPVLSSTLFPANGDGSRSPLRHILPFVYESTGIDTRFTSYLDSDPRSREVFTFHQPKTLALWLSQAPLSVPSTSNNTLRSRLRQLPSRPVRGLQKPQLEALANLEKSLAENKPRALIQTISGRNKTNMVLTSIYRLLEYGGALHILYIADRESQARYISDQFHKHAITTISPQGEKFSRMKTQLFQSDSIDPLARVYITTIEHLSSLFSRTSNDVHYNPKIPIETFDIIFIDDGNLSVNPRWRPILEYFDAFLIGLGIPSNTKARGFFNNNIVYGQLTEQPRALILTVLAGERQAVQVHLTDLKKEIFRDSIYSRGAFTSENQTWDILITQCAMGNMNITSEIQKAIDYFNPQIIVSVGLGAGLKDTKIGDVVVATRIYLHGSEAFSGVRVDVFGRTNRIMRLAQAIASSGDWQRRSRNQASNAFLSSIISSEKIIDSLNLRELLRSAHPDARALDMESAGILATLRRYSSIKTLVVRGISDFADGAKIDSFQEVAAQHASAFAFALLARLELTESLQSKKESEDDDEYYGLVALSYDELEHFLRDQENEYWLVDKRSIEEFITGRPANVEELMYAIAMNGDTTQRVYLFRSDMSPEDVIAATDLEDIPEITREDIDDEYIISSKGSDFLAFDCSVDEASNCSPATLFPYEDYKDGEDVESSASGVETIHPRFSTWLANQQETRTQPFTEEQVLWLNRIRDRIIADGSFKVQDFERAPFTFDGGLVAAHHLFGNELSLLLQDLNGLLKQEE
jgi:nucleoside phosphorylase